jgi:hypothetical protein
VGNTLLEESISSSRKDRGEVTDAEVVDLHVNGLCAMGTTAILKKYIDKLRRDRMFVAEDVADTLEFEEENFDDGEADPDNQWMQGEEIEDMMEDSSLSDPE